MDRLPFEDYQGNNRATTIVTLPGPSSTILPATNPARTADRMRQTAMLEATHENLRACLAKVALDNVAALSAQEAHLYQVAPLGEERYKMIADGYAISAAQRIARW